MLGLFVATNHSEKRRIFEIYGLSATNLHTEFIQREGNTRISLFEYYTQQYAIDFEFVLSILQRNLTIWNEKGNQIFHYFLFYPHP